MRRGKAPAGARGQGPTNLGDGPAGADLPHVAFPHLLRDAEEVLQIGVIRNNIARLAA